MELNRSIRNAGEAGRESNHKPKLGKYLLVGGIAASLGGCNGVTVDNRIPMPGAPQTDAALTDASRASGASNDGGVSETGPNQSGVDGGTGFDGGAGVVPNQGVDGNNLGVDGGVADDSGTPVGVTDGSATDGGVGQPNSGVDGPSATDGGVVQINSVADAPTNSSESGTDSITGLGEDGGVTPMDSAPGTDSEPKDAASNDGNGGKFAIDGEKAADGGEAFGDAVRTDSAVEHDARTVLTTDAYQQDTAQYACNGQSAGEFKGFINLYQQVTVGGVTITYKGVVVTGEGTTMYGVEILCGNGAKINTALNSGLNTPSKGITIDLTNGGQGAVFATITIEEVQGQDAGSLIGTVDAELSEGGGCTASEPYKGFVNLGQPLQYGNWTITYKGIVASDAGASLYDLSFASEDGATTDKFLPGGVSNFSLGDMQMSVDLTNGGRGAVFATIATTCP